MTPTAVTPQQRTVSQPAVERDRVLWLAVRRGLLLIAKAIEERYDLGAH